MQLTDDVKKKIDEMDPVEMMRLWRFSHYDDPMFGGESGTYFADKMRSLDDATKTAASKAVGWDG